MKSFRKILSMMIAVIMLITIALPATVAEEGAAEPAPVAEAAPAPEKKDEKAPDPAPAPEPAPEKKEEKAAEPAPAKTEEKAPEPAPEKKEEKAPEKAPEPAPEKKEEKAPEKTEEKASEKKEEKAPEKTEEKTPEKTEEKTPEKTEEKTPEKTEEKAPEKTEEKAPEKTEEKAEEKAPEQAEEKTEEKATEQAEEKPEEKSEEKAKEKSEGKDAPEVKKPENKPESAPETPAAVDAPVQEQAPEAPAIPDDYTATAHFSVENGSLASGSAAVRVTYDEDGKEHVEVDHGTRAYEDDGFEFDAWYRSDGKRVSTDPELSPSKVKDLLRKEDKYVTRSFTARFVPVVVNAVVEPVEAEQAPEGEETAQTEETTENVETAETEGTENNEETAETEETEEPLETVEGESAGAAAVAALAGTEEEPELTMSVSAQGYSGSYDGYSHTAGASVDVEGAKVEYKVGEGEWTETAPSITNVGTISFQVRATKEGYPEATDSGTLTITPAAMSVTAVGFEGPYDGESHAAGASVDVEGAKVEYKVGEGDWTETAPSITKIGEIYFIVRATKENYTEATASGKLVITGAKLELTVTGYEGTYDGKPHAASASANVEGAKIEYKIGEEGWSTAVPTITNVGTLGFMVRASKEGYTAVEENGELKVNYANFSLTVHGYNDVYDGESHAPTVETDVDGVTIEYKVGEDDWTGTAPSITDVGTVEFKVRATKDNYNEVQGGGTLMVTPATMTLDVDDAEFTYDGTSHPDSISYRLTGINNAPVADATIEYKTGESDWSATIPTITDAGTLTLAVRATHPNYNTVTKEDCTVTVKQQPLTVTVDNASGEVNGKVDKFTYKTGEMVDKEELQGTITFNPTDKDIETLTAGQYTITVSNQDEIIEANPNYAITFVPGILTLTAKDPDITAKITPKTDTLFVYDGQPHEAGYDVTYEYHKGKANDYIITPALQSTSETNAGVYDNTVTGTVTATPAKDNPGQQAKTVTVNVVIYNDDKAKLTISPLPITVNIKGDQVTETYDGKEHKALAEKFEMVGSSTEKGVDYEAAAAAYDSKHISLKDESKGKTITQINVTTDNDGMYKMGLTGGDFENADTNYQVSFDVGDNDGWLKIEPADMTVTVQGYSGFFDGKAHTPTVTATDAAGKKITDVEFEFSTDGGTTWSGTEPSITDVGKIDFQVKATSQNYVDVTEEAKRKGTLEVESAEMTVTVESTFTYDGKPHTPTVIVKDAKEEDIDGPTIQYMDGDDDWSDKAPSITDFKDNRPIKVKVSKENYIDKEVDCNLEINPLPITVNIKGDQVTETYDGKEHKALAEKFEMVGSSTEKGVDYEAAAAAYDSKHISLKDESKGKTITQINVTTDNDGMYKMGLTGGDFENADTNYQVSFDVGDNDGWLKIEPLPITVNVKGSQITTIYTGKEQQALAGDFEMVGSSTEKGVDYEAAAAAYDSKHISLKDGSEVKNITQINVTTENEGMYKMGLTGDDFENADTNYQVSFDVGDNDGWLKIEPATVDVSAGGSKSFGFEDKRTSDGKVGAWSWKNGAPTGSTIPLSTFSVTSETVAPEILKEQVSVELARAAGEAPGKYDIMALLVPAEGQENNYKPINNVKAGEFSINWVPEDIKLALTVPANTHANTAHFSLLTGIDFGKYATATITAENMGHFSTVTGLGNDAFQYSMSDPTGTITIKNPVNYDDGNGHQWTSWLPVDTKLTMQVAPIPAAGDTNTYKPAVSEVIVGNKAEVKLDASTTGGSGTPYGDFKSGIILPKGATVTISAGANAAGDWLTINGEACPAPLGADGSIVLDQAFFESKGVVAQENPGAPSSVIKVNMIDGENHALNELSFKMCYDNGPGSGSASVTNRQLAAVTWTGAQLGDSVGEGVASASGSYGSITPEVTAEMGPDGSITWSNYNAWASDPGNLPTTSGFTVSYNDLVNNPVTFNVSVSQAPGIQSSIQVKPMTRETVPNKTVTFFGQANEYEELTLTVNGTSYAIPAIPGSGDWDPSLNSWSQDVPLDSMGLVDGSDITATLSYVNLSGGQSKINLKFDEMAFNPYLSGGAVENSSNIWGYTEQGSALQIAVAHSNGNEDLVPDPNIATDNSGFIYARFQQPLSKGDVVRITAIDFCGNTNTYEIPVTEEPEAKDAELLGQNVFFYPTDDDNKDNDTDPIGHHFAMPVDLNDARLTSEEGLDVPVVVYDCIEIGTVNLKIVTDELGNAKLTATYQIADKAQNMLPKDAKVWANVYTSKPSYDQLKDSQPEIGNDDGNTLFERSLTVAEDGSFSVPADDQSTERLWVYARFAAKVSASDFVHHGGRGVNFYCWHDERDNKSVMRGTTVGSNNGKYYDLYRHFQGVE